MVSSAKTTSAKSGRDFISTAPASGYTVSRTSPDELLRHDISDEELGALGDMRRDYIWEGKWVAMGVALGAGPNCISALRDAYGTDPKPMPFGDLWYIVIFSVAFVAFGILWWTMRSKSKGAKDLVEEIRARTKNRVQG